ncbi:hypothetical protein EYR38_000148 [Pleurotus pulmonarius]|nr:hypothetical protein EYR38_000148 [Pleurotus pulmonarius]
MSDEHSAQRPDVASKSEPSPHSRPRRRTYSNATYTHAGAGAEPGINPRRDSAFAEFGHIKQASQIEVVDYSNEKIASSVYDNAGFIHALRDKTRFAREPWATVRWINIGGLSWDVLSSVAVAYDLHSLALEDVLQEQGHNHSKADYYQNHLFLRILCHSLASDTDEHDTDISGLPDSVAFPRTASPLPVSSPSFNLDYTPEDNSNGAEKPSRFSFLTRRRGDVENRRLSLSPRDLKHKLSGFTGFRDAARQRRLLKLQALKRGDRVNVKVAPLYMFLSRDGTVITMHPTPNLDFTQPITARLHQDDSVLRTSNDASLLVESILDLVVDRVLEVIDAYQDKIHQIENEILIKPTMNIVHSLHILSGDLILHKRTLDPIKTVIYGLRRYDLDRCIALADMSAGSLRPQATFPLPSPGLYSPSNGQATPTLSRHGSEDSHKTEWQAHSVHNLQSQHQKPVRVEGYMSYKAKTYLADVYDHMEFVLTSLDMFAGISENLINYAFNFFPYCSPLIAHARRRLTVATIIFLPLTLLTGYFGMNFDFMWSLRNHSDLVFWIISLPVMGILLPIFLFHDISRMFHYLKKRMAGERLIKHSVLLFRDVELTLEEQYSLTKVRRNLQPEFLLIVSSLQAFDPEAENYGHGNNKVDNSKQSILRSVIKSIPRVPQVQLVGNGTIYDHEGIPEVVLKHPSHTTFHATHVSREDSEKGFTRFYRWHMDAALYQYAPPKVTTLYGLRVPEGGGQIIRYDDGTGDELSAPLATTAFVSGKIMFDILPPELKSLAVRSRAKYALHPFVWMSRARASPTGLGMESEGLELTPSELPPWDESKQKLYPMVWKNPGTGELHLQVHPCAVAEVLVDPLPEGSKHEGALYAAGAHLKDLKEIRDLLQRMQRPGIAPKLVYPHDWKEKDLMLFHNRGVIHTAVGTLNADQVRVFHQCNLAASDDPAGPTMKDVTRWA